jgi:hypothetical protein
MGVWFFVANHNSERGTSLLSNITKQRDVTAEEILEHFSDLKNYPEEALAPYQEFGVGANTYYFTPGGFLYRKDPGTEEVGGFFCGYLTDEVWRYRTDDS